MNNTTGKVITKAVRIYGVCDLRLEEFELPPLKEDEILAKVMSDSACMSSYKAALQGAQHKRIPDDIAVNPTMIGHEFGGIIMHVGKKWQHKFSEGMKFAIQPALNYKGSLDAPGYSFRYIGGAATYIIIPNEVMEMDCLLEYKGEGFFPASLSEPLSCVIGAFHSNYHNNHAQHSHEMGIIEGGNTAILGGCGPMGLAAINYLFHCDRKPGLLIVTDIDDNRLDKASLLFSEEEAKNRGIELKYVNTSKYSNPSEKLLSLTNNEGYHDIFVYAPVKQLITQADSVLAKDGCLNFFAGPVDQNFSAEVNFYNIHYSTNHIIGSISGNTNDIAEALDLMAKGMNPASMISHIGGLNAVRHTTLNLPKIPGAKKLFYTHIDMELTAIEEFEKKGNENPLFKNLHNICKKNNGLWSVEAESYLLGHYGIS
jgi:threonine dehydrogenase-like Zn-dependent dehydrogenase